MFGLFKKTIDRSLVLKQYLVMVAETRARVDEAARNASLFTRGDYEGEVSAYAYILGWHAVQTSRLSAVNRNIFSAELRGQLHKSGRLEVGESLRRTKFLQDRLETYRSTLSDASHHPTDAQALVSCFIRFLSVKDPGRHRHYPKVASVTENQVAALRRFINEANRRHRFV